MVCHRLTYPSTGRTTTAATAFYRSVQFSSVTKIICSNRGKSEMIFMAQHLNIREQTCIWLMKLPVKQTSKKEEKNRFVQFQLSSKQRNKKKKQFAAMSKATRKEKRQRQNGKEHQENQLCVRVNESHLLDSNLPENSLTAIESNFVEKEVGKCCTCCRFVCTDCDQQKKTDEMREARRRKKEKRVETINSR